MKEDNSTIRYYNFSNQIKKRLLGSHVLESFSVSTDKIYTWGVGMEGQLGDGKKHDYSDATLVNVPGANEFLSVCCGRTHTVALTSFGEVYSWGTDNYGQTGQGYFGVYTKPQQIDELKYVNIIDIACGEAHTLFLNDLGKVYSCGQNDYGQTGQSSYRDQETSKVFNPLRIPKLEPIDIVYIACGPYHSAVISDSGSLYTFGRNDHGQLGIGNKVSTAKPKLVRTLHGNPVRKVLCGAFHTIAMTDEGIFTWGKGSNSNSPVLLNFEASIIDISAGFDHNIALSSSGELYVWGSNSHGQLGFPVDRWSSARRPMKLGFTSSVTEIYAGKYYSVVICEDGNLYSWGKFGDTKTSTPILKNSLPLGVKYFSGGPGHYAAILGKKNSYSLGLLQDSTTFADIKFQFLESDIYAHKCILKVRCRSKAFLDFLETATVQEDEEIETVFVVDIPYAIFSYFIEFLYEDFIPPISPSEASVLRNLALQYQLPRLHTMCESIIFGDSEPVVFSSKLSRDLIFAYENEIESDMVISFADSKKTLKVHRAVLYCRSPYFKTMFDMKMSEYEGELMIAECDFVTFKAIIEDIYFMDTLDITGENVFDVLVAAYQYRSSRLINLTQEFITAHLDTSIISSVLYISKIYSADKLAEAAFGYIERNKDIYNELLQDENYHNLSAEVVRRIESICLTVLETKKYSAYHQMKESAKEELNDSYYYDHDDPNYDSEEEYGFY